MLVPATLHDLLETSDVVGNIRFSHPTLYVFPGGQGDAALFGINGFNMLGKYYEFLILIEKFQENNYYFFQIQLMEDLVEKHAFGILHVI